MPASDNRVFARYQAAREAAVRQINGRSEAQRQYDVVNAQVDQLHQQQLNLKQRINALCAVRSDVAAEPASEDNERQIVAATAAIERLERELSETELVLSDRTTARAQYHAEFVRHTSDPLFRRFLAALDACSARGIEIPRKSLAEILAS